MCLIYNEIFESREKSSDIFSLFGVSVGKSYVCFAKKEGMIRDNYVGAFRVFSLDVVRADLEEWAESSGAVESVSRNHSSHLFFQRKRVEISLASDHRPDEYS